jgi:hypothetical protein
VPENTDTQILGLDSSWRVWTIIERKITYSMKTQHDVLGEKCLKWNDIPKMEILPVEWLSWSVDTNMTRVN